MYRQSLWDFQSLQNIRIDSSIKMRRAHCTIHPCSLPRKMTCHSQKRLSAPPRKPHTHVNDGRRHKRVDTLGREIYIGMSRVRVDFTHIMCKRQLLRRVLFKFSRPYALIFTNIYRAVTVVVVAVAVLLLKRLHIMEARGTENTNNPNSVTAVYIAICRVYIIWIYGVWHRTNQCMTTCCSIYNMSVVLSSKCCEYRLTNNLKGKELLNVSKNSNATFAIEYYPYNGQHKFKKLLFTYWKVRECVAFYRYKTKLKLIFLEWTETDLFMIKLS